MSKTFETSIRIEGARELASILAQLPQRSVEAATRQAANAGATPVVKATRAAVPIESGLMQKAVAKKVKFFKSSATAIAIVGARDDLSGTWHGHKRRPSKYWHLVERGTKRSRPNPFVERGLTESADQAAAKMTQKMAQAVERQAAKLARK